jgi:hypothetical protein
MPWTEPWYLGRPAPSASLYQLIYPYSIILLKQHVFKSSSPGRTLIKFNERQGIPCM